MEEELWTQVIPVQDILKSLRGFKSLKVSPAEYSWKVKNLLPMVTAFRSLHFGQCFLYLSCGFDLEFQ